MVPPCFAIIIGAMKCGTTTLFEQLRSHPQVCVSRRKEPDFFGQLREKNAAGALQRYARLWPSWDPRTHRVAVEASTNYAKHPVKPHAARNLARIAASGQAGFKLIYILRDPLRALESFCRHALGKTVWLPRRCWADRVVRRMVLEGELDEEPLHIYRYAHQLEVYQEFARRDDLLLLDFEELTARPDLALRKVTDFLGLAPFSEPVAGECRHRSSDRLRGSLWRPYLVRMRYGLSYRQALDWRLSQEQRALAQAHFREDALKLQSGYEFDMSGWDLGLSPKAAPPAPPGPGRPPSAAG